MSLASLYVTTPTKEDAMRIAQALLEKRLVACANILEGSTSLYWWDGQIQNDQECVMFCKTRMTLVTKAAALIEELHPYDVPCITATPILKVARKYAEWVVAETTQPEDSIA